MINDNKSEISQRKAALVSGIGLLIMTFAAMYAIAFVFPQIIIEKDSISTVKNIYDFRMLFHSGIFSCIIVIILDVIVAWSLYVFLVPANKYLSLLIAWCRLLYAGIFTVAVFNLINASHFLSNSILPAVSSVEIVNTQVMASIMSFNNTWSFGFIFFGLHLILLGYLAYRAHYIPKLLGILLIIAGSSYLIDFLIKLFIVDVSLSISQFLGWGELIFMFWLLIKGGKVKE